MKPLLSLLPIVGFLIIADSCSKEQIASAAVTNGAYLAGAKGLSRSWRLSSATGSYNGGAVQPINYYECYLDNILTFTNNDAQGYENLEGATKCDFNDPQQVEAGNWALTADGKTLLVKASSISGENFFSFVNAPITVTELNNFSLKLSYSVSNGSDSYKRDFVFVKIN